MKRSTKGRWVAAAIFAFLIASAAGAQKPSEMALAFTAEEVTLTGVPRGGTVILFGIGVEWFNHAPSLTRHAEAVSDNDGDGTVIVRPALMPERAVWVAINLQTGNYTIGAPDNSQPAPLELAEGAWASDGALVEVRREYMEALVVRPGVGAWAARLGDGGAYDADGRPDGRVILRLDRMDRLDGEQKGPPVAIRKDLLVLIDPHSLQTFVREAH